MDGRCPAQAGYRIRLTSRLVCVFAARSARWLGPRVADASPLPDFARRVRLGWVGAAGGGGRNPPTGRSIGGASRSPVLAAPSNPLQPSRNLLIRTATYRL